MTTTNSKVWKGPAVEQSNLSMSRRDMATKLRMYERVSLKGLESPNIRANLT